MGFYTNVRYGKIGMVGRFKTERQDLRVRDLCIVRTDRGKEMGEILTPLEAVPDSMPPESLWDILRRADPADVNHAGRIEKESVPRAAQHCRELMEKLKLPMKLVNVDYVFGGERIIFYFTSESRVDFRELVRQLAHEFRTRIELKQVGARDEARLVGDIGHCGRHLCCRGFLRELGGISMDMAKVQKHTADPSKITGRCGKLMCCLRYEYGVYTEARRLLPAKGARVESSLGGGVVVDQNMLLREVTVEKEGGDRVAVPLEDIRETPKVAAPAPAAEPAWVKVGKAADFAPGTARAVEAGGVPLAVFNVESRLHVLDNLCPHQGARLAEGAFEKGVVTCPVHRWQFDVATGACVGIPGAKARTRETKIEGEDLFVRV